MKKERSIEEWLLELDEFLDLTIKHKVQMLMVGGGAVNFHGYQRHSADVDFWFHISEENLKKLQLVLSEMGFDIADFPQEVKNQEQNISLKFSPITTIELITRFDCGVPFEEAYKKSVERKVGANERIVKVLNLEHLITSKIKAGRNKDLLDIAELKQINKIP